MKKTSFAKTSFAKTGFVKTGFALILVMCICTALSTLLLQLYTRSSFLLLTVKERENTVKLMHATHALMLYAIQLSKYNWKHIINESQHEPIILDDFFWHIDKQKKGNGFCRFKHKDDDTITILAKVELKSTSYSLSCDIKLVQMMYPEGVAQVVIQGWQVK